jgi:hypothetical protein
MMLALLLAFLSFVSTPQPASAEGTTLAFSPAEWEFGTLKAGSRAFVTLHVSNQGSKDVTVSILPTCDCLSTGPSRQVIPAGAGADFRFSILAEDDESGEIRESYLIQTDLKGMDHFFYPVHGTVKGATTKPAG